jgi:hypothetical protein
VSVESSLPNASQWSSLARASHVARPERRSMPRILLLYPNKTELVNIAVTEAGNLFVDN